MANNGNTRHKCGDRLGDWTLEEHLGSGGSGDVWKARRPGHEPHAIKVLRTSTSEFLRRFTEEIKILEKLGNLEGIVPMVEKHIPDSAAGALPWFVMPLALPFSRYAMDKTPVDLVSDFVPLAETIQYLHSKGISHRDIKPANFLYLNARLCLSDFGLVKYPEREPMTPEKRDVGAKFTMAPEMRRRAWLADGLPADVYSFAKSMWIALSGQELGFDGQYNESSILSLKNYMGNTYTTKLDQLLTECTDTDSAQRPTMPLVILRIQEWLELVKDFHRRNLSEWRELASKLFPLAAPTRATWTDINQICAVIGEIAKVRALNHMFYPTGGGNTIVGVAESAEAGFIELHIDKSGLAAELLKPSKFTYESFGADTRWTYFRLEAAEITPTGIEYSVDSRGESEALVEIAPGEYRSPDYLDSEELHESAGYGSTRRVTRFLKGCFVFFSTRSLYNQQSQTYDARHNKMTEDEFRDYIKAAAAYVNQHEVFGAENESS